MSQLDLEYHDMLSLSGMCSAPGTHILAGCWFMIEHCASFRLPPDLAPDFRIKRCNLYRII